MGPMARSDEQTAGSVYLGRYELLSELGRGSYSHVWLARQLSTGQQVAIKRLSLRGHANGAPSSSELERFRRETRLCADLSHPNIVRLLDAGASEDGDEVFAVFEHVPGADLAHVLADGIQRLALARGAAVAALEPALHRGQHSADHAGHVSGR